MSGLEAISWIEQSLLTKYFFYLIWNVLLVTVFARAIIFDVLQNPSKIIELLGSLLPKSSTIITQYVMLYALLIYPAQLLLAGPVVVTWLLRAIHPFKSTPRLYSAARK